MNKKFLSAILFGTLMVTSAGTFVSCKDYDDDIDNLQGQIDANKAGIEELKKLIGEGDYVTNVTKDGDNIVVSFKNAGDKTIELKDEVGSICKVENGELYIDGKATGIKISADAPVTEFKPAVKVEDGKWAVLQADGTYKTTGIPATGVTVSGSQTEGFILTFVNAEGEETVIELPTAASRITSLSVANGAETTVKLNKYTFGITAENKKAWEKATGKTVTSAKFIVADNAENKVSVRVNPVDVDATAIEFVAINGKNEVLPNVTFVANEDKNYATEVRAAYGNGLYHMTVKQFTLADDKASDALDKATADDKGYYALTANKVYRAEYNMKFSIEDATAAIGGILVDDKEVKTAAVTVDAGKAHTVTVENEEDLYDLYLSASQENIKLFGLEFDNEKGTFTITKTPDVVTAAYFDLTVHTLDNSGKVAEKTITVTLSDVIVTDADYATRTLAIVANNTDASKDKNFFTADMATMTKALGNELDAWKRKVANASVAFYSDAKCEKAAVEGDNAAGVALTFVDAEGKELTENAIKSAVDMKFAVTNATASKVFKVNTVYYAKVTFTTTGDSELNSVVVPFKFTVPTLASMFATEAAVFKGDVAYAYMNVADQTNGEAAYSLKRAFAKYPEVSLDMDDETAIVGDYTSTDLAEVSTTFDGEAKITLKAVDTDKATKIPAGYAKELIVIASDKDYEGWAYGEGEGEYVFKVKVMSPIFEGTVTSIESAVEIPATSVDGYKLGNKDIQGTTYNKVAYKVLQDAVNEEGGYWKRPEIASVEAAVASDRVIKIGNDGKAFDAAMATDGKTVVEGYIQVLPQNIAITTEETINVSVTDTWGFVKVNPIKVKVTVE
ncbi:hypothetical protein [Phocaeicola massiliensis]|uniref:hypothetical protein n=1 Tax=Phocaeicola massiliensis TaxID=204516 RepID=UPI00202E38DA|nr:hypothetical protein [Phocaeicola massiliensis]MCM1615889.1 hypothetical protein [Phocaeicola massiliensis]MCM1707602.1 hypothetical protein [Phocaeicola massiliensis]